MPNDTNQVSVILSPFASLRAGSAKDRLRPALRVRSLSRAAARGSLRMTALAAAVLAVAACGKEQPSLGGRADTTESPSGPAAAPTADLAYVTNEDSQELSVIDTRTDSVVATIPVGTRPRGVRVTSDGKTIFVALSGSPKCPPSMPDEECEKLKADKTKDGIAVVDAASRKVTRVLPGGSDPEAFDISRDGTTLFVSNEDAGTASIVDIGSGKIRSTVTVGKEPEGVRLQPDGAAVWVTGETDHNVTLLDTKTGKVIGQIKVGKRPRDLAFTPDGSRAYVTSEVDGTVGVVDVRARKVTKVIQLPKDSKPMGVVVSADGKRVYVANGRGGTLSVIDPATNAVTTTIPVGQRPWGIALTRDGGKLYTANGPSNDVSVVDTGKLQVRKKIPVGKIPWGVAIGPPPGGGE
jgi:PQQ-dependent catabolism-associated beta-propeller protein